MEKFKEIMNALIKNHDAYDEARLHVGEKGYLLELTSFNNVSSNSSIYKENTKTKIIIREV